MLLLDNLRATRSVSRSQIASSTLMELRFAAQSPQSCEHSRPRTASPAEACDVLLVDVIDRGLHIFSDRVLAIRKDEIGQGHIGLDPAGRHLEGARRQARSPVSKDLPAIS